jgi:hypothetical protein
LVGGPPGVELQTIIDDVPSGEFGGSVPVALAAMGAGMVPRGADDIVMAPSVMDVGAVLDTTEGGVGTVIGGAGRPGNGVITGGARNAPVRGGAIVLAVVADEGNVAVAGTEGAGGIVPVVPPIADMVSTGSAGVPGAICPVGTAQFTTVPGVAGLEVSARGASVVSGAPDWVAAENGLGPLSGEDIIAPGVDGRPMDVVPMVETCARQPLTPSSSTTVVNNKRCIALRPPRNSNWFAVCES